jgi:hypothetical protein
VTTTGEVQPANSATSGPGATDTSAGLSLEGYAALREHLENVRRAGVGSQRYKQACQLYERFCDQYGHAILASVAAALGQPEPAELPQSQVTSYGKVTEIGG